MTVRTDPRRRALLLVRHARASERFWFMTDILKGDVDVVVFVVDAEAEHTHVEAGAAMRALLHDFACRSSSRSIGVTTLTARQSSPAHSARWRASPSSLAS